ncbi:GNAT family N-acetyltransferase [Tenacibaculum amylolyticum]|uniref:GNAT family N-acetyltransferase n=1 Tax=Tenacibaculum amylolyticum TaxID=104269 RepID=UPI0038965021
MQPTVISPTMKQHIDIKKVGVESTEVLAMLGRVTYTESHGMYIENKEDLFIYNNKAFSINKIKESLQTPNILYHILYVDELPVGYTKLILNEDFETSPSGKNCRLERIYVLNEFIPMKLGKLLLENVIQSAKELSHDHIWLSVYVKNHRAINFYRKNDFLDIGMLNFLVNGKDYENYVLSKKL